MTQQFHLAPAEAPAGKLSLKRRRSPAIAVTFALLAAIPARSTSAQGSAGSQASASPQFPGITEARAEIDRFAVPGTTILQRRLFLLEGVLAVGYLPCGGEIRSDPSRGVTVGCLQFGLLGRLQPVLLALDRAHPDRLAAAFGSDAAAVRAMLNLPTVAAQVDWARSIFDRSGALPGRWREEFATLAAMPEFQSAYLASTTVRYRRAVGWTLAFGFHSRRALAMMFDLSLFRGLSNEQGAVLATALDAVPRSGDPADTELRRLRVFAERRADMDPDPLLRFHLRTMAEGQAAFLGYVLDLAAFDVTLAPIPPSDLP